MGSQFAQGIAHLAHHALFRGADRILLQLFKRSAGSKDRGKLQAPRWRVSPKHGRHLVAARTGK